MDRLDRIGVCHQSHLGSGRRNGKDRL